MTPTIRIGIHAYGEKAFQPLKEGTKLPVLQTRTPTLPFFTLRSQAAKSSPR
jgi:hypothetical protein